MRPAVLVPRHRPPEARRFDPHGFVERDEVVAVDRGGNREQVGMAVGAQAGVRVLQRAEHDLHDPLRRAIGSDRLEHLHLVAAVGVGRAAERVRQRPHPVDVPRGAVAAERGAAVAIDPGALRHGETIDHGGDVAFDVVQLVGPEHAREHVESVLLVGVDDRRVDPAVGGVPDRPPVAERHRTLGALGPVAGHGRFLGAIVADLNVEQPELPHDATLPALTAVCHRFRRCSAP